MIPQAFSVDVIIYFWVDIFYKPKSDTLRKSPRPEQCCEVLCQNTKFGSCILYVNIPILELSWVQFCVTFPSHVRILVVYVSIERSICQEFIIKSFSLRFKQNPNRVTICWHEKFVDPSITSFSKFFFTAFFHILEVWNSYMTLVLGIHTASGRPLHYDLLFLKFYLFSLIGLSKSRRRLQLLQSLLHLRILYKDTRRHSYWNYLMKRR